MQFAFLKKLRAVRQLDHARHIQTENYRRLALLRQLIEVLQALGKAFYGIIYCAQVRGREILILLRFAHAFDREFFFIVLKERKCLAVRRTERLAIRLVEKLLFEKIAKLFIAEVEESAFDLDLRAGIRVRGCKLKDLLYRPNAEAFIRFGEIADHSVSLSTANLSHYKYCLVLAVADSVDGILANFPVHILLA